MQLRKINSLQCEYCKWNFHPESQSFSAFGEGVWAPAPPASCLTWSQCFYSAREQNLEYLGAGTVAVSLSPRASAAGMWSSSKGTPSDFLAQCNSPDPWHFTALRKGFLLRALLVFDVLRTLSRHHSPNPVRLAMKQICNPSWVLNLIAIKSI